MRRATAGLSLLELVLVLGLTGLAVLLALPALGRARARAQAAAGARQLATTLHGLRWRSVAEARSHGLKFFRDGRGWGWHHVRDGNDNGLRTAEVLSGTDPTLSGPHRLEDAVAPVGLGFPDPGPFPKIPPGRGSIGGDDPVRIGNTQLLAFGPQGTSTGGTLYVTDGRHELYGIVLFGKTGRIRTWRFDRSRGRWSR